MTYFEVFQLKITQPNAPDVESVRNFQDVVIIGAFSKPVISGSSAEA